MLAETSLLRFLQEDGGASPEELASARETLVEAKKTIGTLKIVATPPTAKVTEYTLLGLMPSASAISGFCMVPRAIRPSCVRVSTQRSTTASTRSPAAL